jgi:hypothetical protein
MQEQVTTIVLPEAAIALDKENDIREFYLRDVNLENANGRYIIQEPNDPHYLEPDINVM